MKSNDFFCVSVHIIGIKISLIDFLSYHFTFAYVRKCDSFGYISQISRLYKKKKKKKHLIVYYKSKFTCKFHVFILRTEFRDIHLKIGSSGENMTQKEQKYELSFESPL